MHQTHTIYNDLRLSFIFEDSPYFIIQSTTIIKSGGIYHQENFYYPEVDIYLRIPGEENDSFQALLMNMQSDGFILTGDYENPTVNIRIGAFIIKDFRDRYDAIQRMGVRTVLLNTINFHDNQNPEPAFRYASSSSPTISSTSYTANPSSNIVKPKRKRKVKPKVEIQIRGRNLNI